MASEDDEKERLLPKIGTTTSVIWNWYRFAETDEKQTPLCKVCLKPVVVTCSSTTNLFQHLKRKHPAEWEKCCVLRKESIPSRTSTAKSTSAKQSTLPQSFSSCVPYEKSGARWKAITDAITYFIATDMLPIYSVEKRGFQHMLKVLDARYNVPSRKYFSGVALPQLYNLTRQKDHTGESIALELKDALSSWSLPEERLTCITTDSGSNVIKAMKDNNWPNLKCFGHRLHNAIVNGVKDDKTDRALGLCRKAVSAFSYSWKKRRDMAELQTELGLPPHQLITESPTRWGSRQKMIERFLEQEKAITRILAGDKKTRHLIPTWQDLEVLEAINKAIQPLQEFTDALSGESYVSVSCIKPVLHLFRTNLLQAQEGDLPLTTTIKRNILSYLEDKYSDPENDELLDMASMMDPRFRTTYITPGKLDKIKERAINELADLCLDERPTEQPLEKSSPKKKKKI
ncbi:E3 SUMO-protein ligase ZBED1-like [Neoarius graeffei]|uniref:E3 SUMO-protein ligase ZBED1-like n=1 Tax=Neoarius graeffei TaxID=443677 RepID=UPI00298C20F4|nr:E3 SUMO-protein ligase ZBED1-like [Neoarius graeffei]